MIQQQSEFQSKKHVRNLVIATVILYAASIYVTFGIVAPLEEEQKQIQVKKAAIENQVKEHEKTLPHYKEYLETQKQIAHYRDSLYQTIK